MKCCCSVDAVSCANNVAVAGLCPVSGVPEMLFTPIAILALPSGSVCVRIFAFARSIQLLDSPKWTNARSATQQLTLNIGSARNATYLLSAAPRADPEVRARAGQPSLTASDSSGTVITIRHVSATREPAVSAAAAFVLCPILSAGVRAPAFCRSTLAGGRNRWANCR